MIRQKDSGDRFLCQAKAPFIRFLVSSSAVWRQAGAHL
jgi:hypothetical protein